MTFDIKQFCDTEESRYALQKPWLVDGIVYATDGRIAVRVDAALFPEVGPAIGRVPKMQDIFPSRGRRKLQSLPPLGEHCETCRDKGVVLRECDKCGGSGTHYCDCGDEHECRTCNGRGTQPTDVVCNCVPQIGKGKFARHYLKKIATLPNVRVACMNDDWLVFEFDGGSGVLCGLRIDDAERSE